MSNLKTIYEPTGEPVIYDVWGSGGFSSLIGLQEDPMNGTYHKVSRVFSNKEDCKGLEWARKRGLETKVIPSKDYKLSDPAERERYFGVVIDWVKENPPEIIADSGFMVVIPRLFFEDEDLPEMLNIHPANLGELVYTNNPENIFDAGERRSSEITPLINSGEVMRALTGQHAVHDAMKKRKKILMSTVHFVTPGTDAGTNFIRKPRATEVDQRYVQRLLKYGDIALFNHYAEIFQNHMKAECDVPAYREAFKNLATKKTEIEPKTETLFLDGVEILYGGILMEAN